MFRDAPILKLAIAQTIVWAGFFYLFPALLLRWEQSIEFERDQLTALFTGALLLTAIGSPFAGRWIDRGHGVAVLAGAATIGGASLAFLALFVDPFLFSGLWMVIGLCMAGALYDPCFAVVTRARGEKARAAITQITLFAGFAGTLAFPLAHNLSDLADWRVAAFVFAALILCIAVPLTVSGAKALEQEAGQRHTNNKFEPNLSKGATLPTDGGESVTKTVRSASFILLSIAFACMALVHGMIVSHFLPMLDERGIAPDTAVLAISIIGPMQVFGRLLMISVGQSLATGVLICTSFAAIAFAQLLLLGAGFAAPESALSLILFFVLVQGAAYGVTSILRPSATRELLGEANFGAVAGGVTLASFLATAAAPYMGTILWRLGTYDLLLGSAIGLSLAGLFAYQFAERSLKRRS